MLESETGMASTLVDGFNSNEKKKTKNHVNIDNVLYLKLVVIRFDFQL